MKKTYDQSNLDNKYFIDSHTYNCPFCKRRHVQFSFLDEFTFDWTNEKECHLYQIQCDSCNKISIHFSDKIIPFNINGKFTATQLAKHHEVISDLDKYIFLSIP